MDEIIASVDIGTHKTAVVIGEQGEVGFMVKGFGIARNNGIVRGNIINVEKAEQGLLRALSSAEKQAQLKVKKLVVAVGGSKLRAVKSHGVTSIAREVGRVSSSDVAKIIETAKNIPIPPDAHIVDYAIMDFDIDGQSGIIDPIGAAGSKLGADVMIFIVQNTAFQNLQMVLDGADVIPMDFVAAPIAAAEAILSQEEKEMGAAVFDIGAGTTDVVVYKANRPLYAITIPYAGESVVHDLMVGLKLTHQTAEKVASEFGCAVENMIPEDEEVELPGIGGREPRRIKKKFIGMIIEARLEEIFMMAKQRIEEMGGKIDTETLPAGIVLVGGTSLIPQIVYLAERILKVPVRLGLPGDVAHLPEGMNTPDYHIALGTINIFLRRREIVRQTEMEQGKIGGLWTRLKEWVLRRL
ncbi:cell division protein FtsA [bacterium]|nr:cell division protein FtsA [bacterium]